MDREEWLRRSRFFRRTLVFAGGFIVALGGYALFATVEWYPGRWPLAIELLVFGSVVVVLGRVGLLFRPPNE